MSQEKVRNIVQARDMCKVNADCFSFIVPSEIYMCLVLAANPPNPFNEDATKLGIAVAVLSQ